MEQNIKYSSVDATVATQYFYSITRQWNSADVFCVKHDYLLAEYGQSQPFVYFAIQRAFKSLSIN